MKPSKFKQVIHDSHAARIALIKHGATVDCPIGCRAVSVEARAIGSIHFGPHRQDHPNSALCYWSGLEIPEEIDGQAVNITFFSAE